MSTTYRNLILGETGLVRYFPMDDGQAGATMVDLKNGQDGTYAGTVTYRTGGLLTRNDPDDKSVTLDGTSGYGTNPDHADIDLGDVFTLEIWINRVAQGYGGALFDKNTNGYYLSLTGGTDAGLFKLEKRNSALIVTSTAAVSLNTTHHLVATKNGATVKLYLDGVDVTGTVTNATCANTASALLVGFNHGGTAYYGGRLGHAALYNVALTARQVETHYRTGMASDPATYTFIDPPDFVNSRPISAPQLELLRENTLAAGEGQWTVQVVPFGPVVTATNWATYTNESTSMMNGYRESTGAQNAQVGWDITLVPGTWTFYLLHRKGTDAGIYTVALDGGSIGTIDGYNGTTSKNQEGSITGISVTTALKKRLTVTMATKNASSSSYVGRIQLLTFIRTA